MRVPHLLLVVPVGAALLAAGVLPAEYVHRRADDMAPLVHSHLESEHWMGEPGHAGDPHEQAVSESHHDQEQTTVGLAQVVGSGQTVRSDYAPVLTPEILTATSPGEPRSSLSQDCCERALSPPPRPGTPRAPPA